MKVTIDLLPIFQIIIAYVLLFRCGFYISKRPTLRKERKLEGLTFDQLKAKGQAQQQRIAEIKKSLSRTKRLCN